MMYLLIIESTISALVGIRAQWRTIERTGDVRVGVGTLLSGAPGASAPGGAIFRAAGLGFRDDGGSSEPDRRRRPERPRQDLHRGRPHAQGVVRQGPGEGEVLSARRLPARRH